MSSTSRRQRKKNTNGSGGSSGSTNGSTSKPTKDESNGSSTTNNEMNVGDDQVPDNSETAVVETEQQRLAREKHEEFTQSLRQEIFSDRPIASDAQSTGSIEQDDQELDGEANGQTETPANRPSSARSWNSQQDETDPEVYQKWMQQREDMKRADPLYSGIDELNEEWYDFDETQELDVDQGQESEDEFSDDDGNSYASTVRSEPAELPSEEEIIAKYSDASGVVSSFKVEEARKEAQERMAAKEYIEKCAHELKERQSLVREGKERLLIAKDTLVTMIGESKQLVGQMAKLKESENENDQLKLKRLGKSLAAMEQQRSAQKETIQRENKFLAMAEKQLSLTEIEFTKIKDYSAELERLDFVEQYEQAVLAKYVGEQEEKARRARQKRAAREEERQRLKRETREAKAKEQMEKAKEYRTVAHARARVLEENRRMDLEMIEQVKVEKEERHRQAILSLQRNIEAAHADLKAANERATKKKKKAANRVKREKEEILASGGNPYEVFRRRAQEKKIKERVQGVKDNRRIREVEIAAKVLQEEQEWYRQQKKLARERGRKEQYAKDLTLGAREERIARYMQDRAGEKGVLDVTGRIGNLHPSEFLGKADKLKKAKEIVEQKLGGELQEEIEREKKLRGMISQQKRQSRQRSRKSSQQKGGSGTVYGDEDGLEYDSDSDGPEDEDARQIKEEFKQPEFDGLWDERQKQALRHASKDDYFDVAVSQYERNMLEKARKKQRENIVQKQVVLGKEFKGDAFIASPSVIEFKDFDVDEEYEMEIVMTNVSFTFNYFKVLDMGPKHKDFFEISYKPPGRMSAGLTCPIKIKFMPKVNEDIHDVLPLLSQTGPINIPIRCLTKKAIIRVEPEEELSFGSVVLGEKRVLRIKIVNEGALATGFEILENVEEWEDEDESSSDEEEEAEEEMMMGQESGEQDDPGVVSHRDILMAQSENKGGVGSSSSSSSSNGSPKSHSSGGGHSMLKSVFSDDTGLVSEMNRNKVIKYKRFGDAKGYADTFVEVTVEPLDVGWLELPILLRFDDPMVPDHELLITGFGSDVPIFVERETIDFRVCYFDCLYRDVLVVNNRGKIALQCHVEVPGPLRGCLEFVPKMGYVQSESSFQIQLKFRPTRKLLARLIKNHGDWIDEESGVMSVPIRVEVPDQVLPVYFTLRAQLTLADLVFDPPSLEFGTCSTRESKAMTFKMTNQSILAQKIGLINGTTEFRVEPNDGFGTILPGETVEWDVVFSPTAATKHRQKLVFKTGLNREYSLMCHGEGDRPGLCFDVGMVKMQATAVGETVRDRVWLENGTKQDMVFEFGKVTDASGSIWETDAKVNVFPQVGVVPSGGKLGVLVEYRGGLGIGQDWWRAQWDALQQQQLQQQQQLEEQEAADSEQGDHSHSSSSSGNSRSKKKEDGKRSSRKNRKDKESGSKKSKSKSKDKRQKEAEAAALAAANENQELSQEEKAQRQEQEFQNWMEIQQRALTNNPVEMLKIIGDMERMERNERIQRMEEQGGEPQLVDMYATPWSLHRDWIVPCYIAKASDIEQEPEEEDEEMESSSVEFDLIHLGVHTTSIKPSLVVVSDGGSHRIDFGALPVEKSEIRVVSIKNRSREELHLTMEPLSPHGGFTVLNALQGIQPGATADIVIGFNPEKECRYFEKVVLRSELNDIELRISGVGVRPRIVVEPRDGILDLGDIVAGEWTHKTFSITSTSNFDIGYRIRMARNGAQNYNGIHAFDCSPCDSVIPAGETREIQVSFHADHACEFYHDTATIEISGEDEGDSYSMELKGRCWWYGMYALGGEQGETEEDLLDVDVEERQSKDMLLVFDYQGEREGVVKGIVVGSVANASEKEGQKSRGGGGEYQVEFVDKEAANRDGFSIVNAKSAVDNGGRVEAQFQFAPKAKIGSSGLGNMVGQWKEAHCVLTLKGGVPAIEGKSAVVNVTLRGYIGGFASEESVAQTSGSGAGSSSGSSTRRKRAQSRAKK